MISAIIYIRGTSRPNPRKTMAKIVQSPKAQKHRPMVLTRMDKSHYNAINVVDGGTPLKFVPLRETKTGGF